MPDGSVRLDMSINESSLEKALQKLLQTVKGFSESGTKQLGNLDKALESITQNAQQLKIEPSVQGMKEAERQLDSLNATIDNQRYQLKNCRDEYQKVSEEFGDASDKALALERKILNLESAIQKNIRKSDDMAKALGDMEDAFDDAAKAADAAGEKFDGSAGSVDSLNKKLGDTKPAAEGAGSGVSVLDVSLGNLVAQGISAAVSGINDLLDSTKEYRKEMSLLTQNAADAGVSMQITNEAMRSLNAITGETDSNLEAVSNLLASGFKDNGLLDAVDTLSGAVIKFPDTMKIENLAESLQETIATGEATGQLSELLGRLGINAEDYNKRLERMSESQRGSYTISLLQKKGLADVNEEYRKNNKNLIDAANAEYDFNQAMAELAEVLDPIRTEILTEINNLLTEHKDEIQAVIGVIGDFVSWVIKVVDAFLDLPAPMQAVIVALAAIIGLVVTFGTSSGLAINMFAKGVAAGTKALSSAAPAAAKAGASFAVLALEIIGVAIAIALVVSAIASLVRAFKGVPNEVNFEVNNVPDINQLKNDLKKKGYASGTASAAPGYAWVGEEGPELVKFSGGEEVLTATQSMARRAVGTDPKTIVYQTTTNVFKVDDIRTYQQIEKRMKQQRLSQRMGYVGV